MGLRGDTAVKASQTWRSRLRAFSLAAAVDTAVAVALACVAVATLATAEPSEFASRPADPFAYGLALTMTLPLAVRRCRPLAVFGVALAGHAAFGWRDYIGENVDFFGPILAFYTVAAQCPRRMSVSAALLTAATVLAVGRVEVTVGQALSVALILGGVWFVGDTVRSRRLYVERLAAQAEELRAARLNLAEQAVSQERLRIARELHDVVAHHMSVIVIQSALAKDRLTSDPGAARRAMEQVESVGRNALREMRQILGVLRQAGEQ